MYKKDKKQRIRETTDARDNRYERQQMQETTDTKTMEEAMRRHSILFIDDEELIRQSFLKLVDWESREFDVAGVFKDGEDAWDYLASHPVDIIVTDINMPFMNGISLLEHIRRENLRTRVLFLTGYEYFEYAHKAVQLKAFDFLLKPVTTEQLLNAVERAVHDIEKEEAAQEAVGKSLELSQIEFVNQLLYGHLKREDIKKEAMAVGISPDANGYLAMMAAVDEIEGNKIPDGQAIELKHRLQETILKKKEELERAEGESFDVYFARNLSPHIQMLLLGKRKGLFTADFVRRFVDCLLGMEEEGGQYRVTVAAGRSYKRMEDMPEAFQEVLHAARDRHILKGKGWKAVHVSDFPREKEEKDKVVLPTDTFLQHIRMGMAKEVEQDIRQIYETFRHKEYISLASAKMVTTELAITAFKGEKSSSDQSVSYLYYLNHIQQLNTLDELEDDITEFAVGIANRRKEGGNHKREIANKAINFLKCNYMKENLSLNDTAAFLNISVPYLAVLFKQETKKNFSAHLLEIRMEKAKELLRTTSSTVGEIAEAVGYSSSQYFAVCFKKYTGISPGAYREGI